MGLSVRRLSQHDDTVTVEFGDATADCYDLVIGADGIHSTVRQLTVGGNVRPVGQLAWRFVTECPPEVTTWTVLLGRNVTFLAVPIGQGQVYCYCDAPPERIPRPRGDDVKGALVELLTGFAGPVPAILNTLRSDDAVHVAPIEEVTIDRWSRGSVLLVGDAAHATSPNMAEGAAMALEDGLVLAECLASEGDVSQAAATFQARRNPRTQWVHAQTHRRDRTRNLPPALRNLVLRRRGPNIFHANYRRLLDPP
jgi:2-polyprenyl-6-methoxyphenol hydroxylase-like FAD-dependent oxidoreductase